MRNSNIKFVSNVYPCKSEISSDREFISKVNDYYKLYNFMNSKYSSNVPMLSSMQRKILNEGARCKEALNDPCWGMVETESGVYWKCKCINTKCKRFKDCRDDFDESEISKWKIDSSAIDFYGDSRKQKKYYLVSLLSYKEKNSYFNHPKSNVHRHKLLKIEENKRKIIGYEKIRFSDYCDEQYQPIYEDELEQQDYKSTQYGSISYNISTYLNKKYAESGDSDREIIRGYKDFQSASKSIVREDDMLLSEGAINNEFKDASTKLKEAIHTKSIDDIKLITQEIQEFTHFIDDKLYKISEKELLEQVGGNQVTIVAKNEAIMQYLASIFVKKEIDFSLEVNEKKIVLVNYENIKVHQFENVLLDKQILDENSNNVEYYNNLQHILENTGNKLAISNMSDKEFILDTRIDSERWFAEGINGLVYTTIMAEDIQMDSYKENNISEVILEKHTDEYKIAYSIKNSDNQVIGKMSEIFISDVRSVIPKDIQMPDYIEGITLDIRDGNVKVIGLGHLVYNQY